MIQAYVNPRIESKSLRFSKKIFEKLKNEIQWIIKIIII